MPARKGVITVNGGHPSDFYSLLAATARSSEIPESADVYGWLCGSWDLDILCYRGVNVAEHGLRGEVMRPVYSKDVPCKMSGSCREAMSVVRTRTG